MQRNFLIALSFFAVAIFAGIDWVSASGGGGGGGGGDGGDGGGGATASEVSASPPPGFSGQTGGKDTATAIAVPDQTPPPSGLPDAVQVTTLGMQAWGGHASPALQAAWGAYGESAFSTAAQGGVSTVDTAVSAALSTHGAKGLDSAAVANAWGSATGLSNGPRAEPQGVVGALSPDDAAAVAQARTRLGLPNLASGK